MPSRKREREKPYIRARNNREIGDIREATCGRWLNAE